MVSSRVLFFIALTFLCGCQRVSTTQHDCESLTRYVSPATALHKRELWTNNFTFELEGLLNLYSPRGTVVGNEPPASIPYGHRRFDMIGPVGPLCSALEEYGTGDGTKRACALQQRADDTCTIVSIGSNGQWDFEQDVYEKTKCWVHTFDCTVGPNVKPPDAISSRVTLHRQCIGTHDEPNRAFVKWDTLLESIGLSGPPTFLKVDIEGYEWEVLPAIIQTSKHPPLQIAFELHYVTQMEGLSWFLRRKTEAEIGTFIELLVHNGYFVIDRNDNEFCPHCTELLVARLCLPSLAPRTFRAKPQRSLHKPMQF